VILRRRNADLDYMNLNVILSIAGVLAAWIMLSVIGNERQRGIRDQQATRPPAAPKAAAPAVVKPAK
jgi:hypothetical protein